MNLQRWRVPLGFAFVLVYLFLCQPTWNSFWIGMLPASLGYGLRVWASGHLYKWKNLAVSGPYRWTRNPLYLGSFIMGFGFMLASARWALLIAFPILFILIYVPVIRKEEKELVQGYGDAFPDYRKRVPIFVPRRPEPGWPEGERRRFSWSQVLANREHHTGLGFCLVTLFLVGKLIWW